MTTSGSSRSPPGAARPTRRATRAWARATRSRSWRATTTCCSRSATAPAASSSSAGAWSHRRCSPRTGPCARSSLDADRTYVVVLRDLPGKYSFETLFSQRLALERAADPRRRDGGRGRGAARGLRRRADGLALRADRRAAGQARHRAPGAGPLARVPPVVPGPADRRPQGRALHARAGRRHRPQAPQPRRSGLARARRALPRVPDRARDRRGRQGRRRRPARRPPERAAFEHVRRRSRRSARGSTSTGWRGVWALRRHRHPRPAAHRPGLGHEPARQAPRDAASSCTSTTRTSSTRSSSPGRTSTTRRRPGTASSATPSAPSCARRRTRSPSSRDLPPEVRRFVLWHRQGQLGLRRVLRVPGPLPKLFGDQDGLFGSACNQYRDSMNHVADWARERGLMDHTGDGVRPARGEPVRGAPQPAVAGGAAAAPRRLRLRPPRGRRGAADGLRAAAERARRAARPDRAVLDPDRGRDRAAGPHGAAAAVRPAGADHRAGPGGRLAVRGRRRHRRGAAAARGRRTTSASARAPTRPCWARCRC